MKRVLDAVQTAACEAAAADAAAGDGDVRVVAHTAALITKAVALARENTILVPVAKLIADKLTDWHGPVNVRLVEWRDGLYVLEVMELDG